MPDAYVGGQRLRLTASRLIGQGGEAEIYDIGNGRVLKLYKLPNHPDYQGLPSEQEGASKRIETIQKKLRVFPKGLPGRVIAPIDVATNATGDRVLGYTMPFLSGAEVLMRYRERRFREQGAVTNKTVGEIFQDLHKTVVGTHQKGVVFGDFNDLNVLVKGTQAHVVDIDSSQFGPYFTSVFTAQFVDPILCDSKATNMQLVRPHNEMSDWYAFTVMYMWSLLYVDPYGGVYRPTNQAHRVNHDVRPLHRITVFNPEVKYPKAAIPFSVLPDDLLEYFHRVFEKDERGIFPTNLLELPWVECPSCGTEHARNTCPNCAFIIRIERKVETVRGQVTVEKVFSTAGIIVFATYQDGKLLFLYHENGQYKREDNRQVVEEALDPSTRFRIRGRDTLIGRFRQVRVFKPDMTVESEYVDGFGNLPVFDANGSSMYWTTNDTLVRNGRWGNEKIGNILSGQTLFWVGPEFGFGFYRAGNISMAFVFDAQSNALNDNVKLVPSIRGQLVDSTAVFTSDLCWFFTSTREGGKIVNRCYQIKKDGTVVGTAEADADDSSWLGTIRGKAAVGNFLFAPTDDGIVRVEAQNGQISVTRQFPDTESFVDAATQLFVGTGGIYAVTRKEVNLIRIG